MAAKDAKLGCTGLDTNANPYTDKRDASLVRADEAVIRKPGIIEQRPGLPAASYGFGVAGSRSNSGCAWLGKRFVVYGSTLTQDTGSAFSDFAGVYATPSNDTVVRFAESGKRLFLTSATGPHVLDSLDAATASATEAGNPRRAGMPRGLEASGRVSGTTGRLAADRARAYRHVWGYVDANGAVILGAPSSRVVVVNPAALVIPIGGMVRASNVVTVTVAGGHSLSVGQSFAVSPGEADFAAATFVVTSVTETTFTYVETDSDGASTVEQTLTPATGDVTLTIPVPLGITTQHFCQVYATRIAAEAETDPTDEHWQIYEDTPSPTDITNGFMFVTDITPDSMLGPPLYSNANQEGQDQANDRPPLARDLVELDTCLIYAHVTELSRVGLNLLGIGSDGLSVGDTVTVQTEGGTAYTFEAATAEDTAEFQVFVAGSASQNVERTARSFVRQFNKNASASSVYAYYVSGPNDAPGRMVFEAATHSTGAIQVFTGGTNRPDAFYPSLRFYFAPVSVVRASDVVTVTTAVAHGLSVGDSITLQSSDAAFLSGDKTVASVPLSTTFTYAEAGSDATASPVPTAHTAVPLLESPEAVSGAVVAIAKPGLPEAVPLTSRATVGSGTADILRVARLGDTVFIFKTDGLFRLFGSWPNFSIREFDPTVVCVAPSTVARVGTRLYALCTRGVLPITESGVSAPVSAPIDTDLSDIYLTAETKVLRHAHAVGYETKAEYHLAMPATADSTFATQSWILNVENGTWTHSDVATRWGMMNPAEQKLVFAQGDGNKLLVERQALTADDYQDTTGVGVPLAVQWAVFVAGNPTALKTWHTVTLLFGSAKFSRATVSFATEFDEVPVSLTIEGAGPDSTVNGPRSYVVPVPMSHSLSTQLSVTLEHAVAGERVSLHGAVVSYTVEPGAEVWR